MKKKYVLLMICIMTILMVSGCGLFKRPLTIYIDKTFFFSQEAVAAFQKEHTDVKLKVVTFDSHEEMKKQMNAELMSGKGPDVLLFNGVYGVDDPFKIAVAGSLLALDEQVSELDEEFYFTTILDAGIANGHQYFLPLSWNILQAYSSQGVIEEKGYGDDLYAAYVEDAATLANDDTMGISSNQYGRMDGSLLNYFLDVAGVELIDWESGELNNNKDKVQQVSEFVKVVSNTQEKNREIAQRYSSDFAGAVAHFTYLTEDFAFMNNLRYYQSVYPHSVNDEMYFAPYKNLDGGITAQVIEYGAINAYTKHENQAWELLRYILNYTGDLNYSKYDREETVFAPVNKAVYATYVEELATEESHGPGHNIAPLEAEWVQVLEVIPAEINTAIIPNGAMGKLIQDCIDPYLAGEETFDICYEKLMQHLQMYLAE